MKTSKKEICKECEAIKQGIKDSAFNPPVGYNPLEQIRGAAFWWVPAPFNGTPIWVKLRCLNQTQQMAYKKHFSVDFRTEREKKRKKPVSYDELIEIYNEQEAACVASLVWPTYDEIIEILTGEDFLISQKKKEILEIKEMLNKVSKEDKKKQEYKDLLKEIEAKELWLGFLLPNDFMGFISAWSRGVDKTDVAKLSRQSLLDAAIVADRCRNSPSDNISGVFSDVMKDEINKSALMAYQAFLDDKKREKQLMKKGYKV